MNQGTTNAGFLLALLAALSVSCILAVAGAAAGVGPAVISMQLSHTDAGRSGLLTPGELLQRMVLHSKAHAAARFLFSGGSSSSSSSPAAAVVVPGKGEPFADEYLVSFGIGTPPQRVELTLDTGSDLVWTQCQPCVSCYDQSPFPYLDTSTSTTFSPFPCDSSTCQQHLPWPPSCDNNNVSVTATQQGWGSNQTCVYNYMYADMSVSNGVLAADTFTFDVDNGGGGGGGGGAVTVNGVAFGCGVSNKGLLDFNSTGTGIAGFGRGPLSLPSQLNVDNFSYCFTDITGSTPSGAVLLGLPPPPANNLLYGGGSATVQTTPFNMTSDSSYYYLNLQSISVGSTTLDVPASAFALNADGVTGGTIIDSGTSITLLPPHVYSLLRDAFVSELNTPPVAVASLPDDVLCFPATVTATAMMPTLRLKFDGGATMEVPPANYVFQLQDDDGTVCIAIASNGGDNTTVIGNYQQQNMHVMYDLAGNTLSFVPAQCDRLIYDDLAGDTRPFSVPAQQCDELGCSAASRSAVLRARGCASFLCAFLSIAIVFRLIKLD